MPMPLMDHLPILHVLLPLIAAPVLMLVRSANASWALAAIICWLTFGVVVLLLGQVLVVGVIEYEIGGWPPPWGIVYRIDAVNGIVLTIVSGMSALVSTYARKSVMAEIEERNQSLFYTVFLLCVAGLLGVAATGDAFNVFVFLEISSLSTYVLVALGANRDRRALSAAINYLIAGTIGATFFVIGVGFLYMTTGTLNMVDIAIGVSELGDNRTLRVSFAFIVVGLGLKLAMFPLHLWLPNAYSKAPSAVTAFLAATSTKVAVYVMMRFIFTVYGTRFAFQEVTLLYLFLPLALVGMMLPSIVAVYQVNIKRMLAYSSVAQIGYMLLGISIASVLSLSAASVHLFNHALMKGALFMALGAVVYRVGSARITDFQGIGKQMPWTMGAFVGGGLSLIGVPLTVGFVSKWLLIQSAIESDLWWVSIPIVVTSLIAAVYVWRVFEQAYLQPVPEGREVKEAPISLLVPMWLLVAANVYFGIDASLTTDVATRAAEALLGGSP